MVCSIATPTLIILIGEKRADVPSRAAKRSKTPHPPRRIGAGALVALVHPDALPEQGEFQTPHSDGQGKPNAAPTIDEITGEPQVAEPTDFLRDP